MSWCPAVGLVFEDHLEMLVRADLNGAVEDEVNDSVLDDGRDLLIYFREPLRHFGSDLNVLAEAKLVHLVDYLVTDDLLEVTRKDLV